MDIQIRIILVRLAREHSPEFQFLKRTFKRRQILLHRLGCVLVVFLHGEVEQIAGVITTGIEGFYGCHHGLERGSLSTQRLGPVGIVPNTGLSQLELDFFQSILLDGVVKDTPSTRQCVRGYL